jgi:hypothetical protein
MVHSFFRTMVIYPEEQPQELLISLLFSGEKSPKGDTVF